MFERKAFRATLIVAIGALALVGACTDGSDELAGPAIPVLESTLDDGSETVELAGWDAEHDVYMRSLELRLGDLRVRYRN